MKLKLIFGILAAGVFLASCGPLTGSREPDPAMPGTPVQPVVSTAQLPSFRIEDAQGKVINLADLKGKKVFVNLWASWCPPCRAEMPSLQSLYSRTDPSKVAFVFLSMDEDFSDATGYVQKKGYTLPVYYPAENLPPVFQVDGIPTTFVFDRDGQLIHRQTGMADYTGEEIQKLLQ